MKRDDKVLAVYPPHPEEGASMCASEKRNRCVAPVSKDGAAPWFETPRTRLRNRGRPKIAAPHHEAERDHECVKLIGIRFSSTRLRRRITALPSRSGHSRSPLLQRGRLARQFGSTQIQGMRGYVVPVV